MNENIKDSVLILTVLRELNYASKHHYSGDVKAFCGYLLEKVESEMKEWGR